MYRHQDKKICVQDALEFVLNGNDSDVEELSSDEEENYPDFFLAQMDDEENDRMNAKDDEDDPCHARRLGGAANNMPYRKPKKLHTFGWRQRDMPIPEDAFNMERERGDN